MTTNRHWHGFMHQTSGADVKNEFTIVENLIAQGRPPRVVRDWLRYPASSVQVHADSPEAAVQWLRAEYEAVEDQLDSVALATPKDERFARALASLQGSDALAWCFWLGTTSQLRLAVVGMLECPANQRRAR